MHSKIMSIDDIGICLAPYRVLPTKKCIPSDFVEDFEIDRIESVEKRSGAAINQNSCIIHIEGWPIGIRIYTFRSIVRIRQPHNGCPESRINNLSSSRR